MLLSCRFLNDVQNVNSFETAPQVEFSAGDSQTLYLQLIDASLDRSDQGFFPPGRRYVPPVGSTLQVTFVNVDDARKLVRGAVQPFVLDGSIWSVTILPTDPIAGTVNLNFLLTEAGGRVLNARLTPGVVVRVR